MKLEFVLVKFHVPLPPPPVVRQKSRRWSVLTQTRSKIPVVIILLCSDVPTLYTLSGSINCSSNWWISQTSSSISSKYIVTLRLTGLGERGGGFGQVQSFERASPAIRTWKHKVIATASLSVFASNLFGQVFILLARWWYCYSEWKCLGFSSTVDGGGEAGYW
jgi:hypothetical protein